MANDEGKHQVFHRRRLRNQQRPGVGGGHRQTAQEFASCVYDYPSGEAGILLDAERPEPGPAEPGRLHRRLLSRRWAGRVRGGPAAARLPAGARGGHRRRHDRLDAACRSIARACRWPCGRSFANNLAAQAWLWKDHTGFAEAAEITDKAGRTTTATCAKCGGAYSSEWFWSKILHCQRTAPKVFDAAYSWVELADFVPAYLTGNLDPDTLPRGICAAGHKAMYHEQWGGLPQQAIPRRARSRPCPRWPSAMPRRP